MLWLAISGLWLNLGMLAFFIVCVLLILAVLVQKPQGGGLSAAFGAGSGSAGQTAFGAKTGDALTVMTIGLFVLWLLVAVVLNWVTHPEKPAPMTPEATSSAPANGQVPAAPSGETPAPAQNPGESSKSETPAPVQPPAEPQTPPATPPAATPAGEPATPPAADPAAPK